MLTRNDLIKKLIVNKRVLDIGCVGSSQGLYKYIRTHASYTLGIDLNKEKILQMQREGLNVQYGNAETFIADEKFDVVIAGELIEHLANPGLFLRCATNNLRKNGVLFLSTPNAYSFSNVLRSFIKRDSTPKNHVQLYSKSIICNLLSMFGFREIYVYHTGRSFLGSHRKIRCLFENVVTSLLPQLATQLSIIAKKLTWH